MPRPAELKLNKAEAGRIRSRRATITTETPLIHAAVSLQSTAERLRKMAAAPDVDGQGQLLSTQTTLQTGDTQTLDNTGYCLLSLDGGGVRGLATLRVLQSIMTRLNNEREDAGLLPRKPCEIFDLIGGTSTGG